MEPLNPSRTKLDEFVVFCNIFQLFFLLPHSLMNYVAAALFFWLLLLLLILLLFL